MDALHRGQNWCCRVAICTFCSAEIYQEAAYWQITLLCLDYHLQLPKLVTENVFLILGQMNTFGFGVSVNQIKIKSLWCITVHLFFVTALHMTQIKIKSNHFYCHITTAQVPWWVKFLRACSTQCKKTKNYLYIDSTYTCRLYRRQCAKKHIHILSTHSVL